MRILLFVCWLGLAPPTTVWAGAVQSDSLSRRSTTVLVADLARLIKQYAYFHGGTAVFRYDAWADTTQGLKLYVGEQVAVLGGRAEPDWYCVDFAQPLKPEDLKVGIGRNDNFWIEVSKRITTKTKIGKHRTLGVFFCTDKKKRTTDFGQLHGQLSALCSELVSR